MNAKIVFLKCIVNAKQYFRLHCRLLNSYSSQKICKDSLRHENSNKSLIHCYKTLFPWKTTTEFSKSIISSIIYNQDGLIAINKPFGIKIRTHGSSEENTNAVQYTSNPSIPDCKYTLEDALPEIQNHLNLPNLIISKTCDRYSSGVVLLTDSENTKAALVKSFRIARHQMRNHITHWFITLGYPVTPYRTERVGIKNFNSEDSKSMQSTIVNNPSKRSCKRREVLSFRVEYRTICVNPKLETSLVEISTSSDFSHLVRVYASERIATILGDTIYNSRIKTLLGIPVKVHLQNSAAFNMQPLPEEMSKTLSLPKGVKGHSLIPNMLHMRSILLPSFKGKDIIITAEPPSHFQWTAKKLNLLS